MPGSCETTPAKLNGARWSHDAERASWLANADSEGGEKRHDGDSVTGSFLLIDGPKSIKKWKTSHQYNHLAANKYSYCVLQWKGTGFIILYGLHSSAIGWDQPLQKSGFKYWSEYLTLHQFSRSEDALSSNLLSFGEFITAEFKWGNNISTDLLQSKFSWVTIHCFRIHKTVACLASLVLKEKQTEWKNPSCCM